MKGEISINMIVLGALALIGLGIVIAMFAPSFNTDTSKYYLKFGGTWEAEPYTNHQVLSSYCDDEHCYSVHCRYADDENGENDELCNDNLVDGDRPSVLVSKVRIDDGEILWGDAHNEFVVDNLIGDNRDTSNPSITCYDDYCYILSDIVFRFNKEDQTDTKRGDELPEASIGSRTGSGSFECSENYCYYQHHNGGDPDHLMRFDRDTLSQPTSNHWVGDVCKDIGNFDCSVGNEDICLVSCWKDRESSNLEHAKVVKADFGSGGSGGDADGIIYRFDLDPGLGQFPKLTCLDENCYALDHFEWMHNPPFSSANSTIYWFEYDGTRANAERTLRRSNLINHPDFDLNDDGPEDNHAIDCVELNGTFSEERRCFAFISFEDSGMFEGFNDDFLLAKASVFPDAIGSSAIKELEIVNCKASGFNCKQVVSWGSDKPQRIRHLKCYEDLTCIIAIDQFVVKFLMG